METFPRLAKAAFQRRSFLGQPCLPKALEFLISIFKDCLYPAGHIESALKEAFGTDKGLLEMSHATSYGTRVGIPVATLRGPSLCLFTSYNGIGSRKSDLGDLSLARSSLANADNLREYHIIESHDGAEQPLLWEV